MAVVQEQFIGNTHIRIHDDCCANASKETIEAILQRIASRAQADISAAENAKGD